MVLEFESRKSKTRIGKLAAISSLMIVAWCGYSLLGTTLASNIGLNSNQRIQFGQGSTQTLACDRSIVVTPYSKFINDEKDAGFRFNSLTVSDINMDSCNNKKIQIDFFNRDSGRLTNVVDDIDTALEFSVVNGIFRIPDNLDVTFTYLRNGSPPIGQISITLNHPQAAAKLVDSITLQSSSAPHSLTDFLIHYDFANPGTYSGIGTQVYDLNGNILGLLSDSNMFHLEDGGYIDIDGSQNRILRTSSDSSPLFLERGHNESQSIILWIRPKSDGIIFDEQGEPNFNSSNWYDSQIELAGGKFYFRFWPMVGSYLSPPTVVSYPDSNNPAGTWYQIALIYDGTFIHAYVNGVDSYSTTSRVAPWSDYHSTYFGLGTNDATAMYNNTGATFDLASLRIYANALSGSEINALYLSEAQRFD